MAEDLPPTVSVNLSSGSLLDYWRARAEQHTNDSYAGVRLSKFPEDLRVYEHLLWLQAPDVIVEIGTDFGGSALWFRDRMRALHGYGRINRQPLVVTVDLDQTLARRSLNAVDPGYGEQIKLVEGDVREARTFEAVREYAAGRDGCLVIEDSAHVYSTTRASLDVFSGLVPVGGFMVVEDGCVDVDELRISDEWPRGVLPALDDWLATPIGQAFVTRRDLELYGVSCHPRGFLQRVR
jgi:cephalosporin hydroxylase